MESVLLCIIYINHLSSFLFLGGSISSRSLFFSGSGFTFSEENNVPKNFISLEPRVHLFGLRVRFFDFITSMTPRIASKCSSVLLVAIIRSSCSDKNLEYGWKLFSKQHLVQLEQVLPPFCVWYSDRVCYLHEMLLKLETSYIVQVAKMLIWSLIYWSNSYLITKVFYLLYKGNYWYQ